MPPFGSAAKASSDRTSSSGVAEWHLNRLHCEFLRCYINRSDITRRGWSKVRVKSNHNPCDVRRSRFEQLEPLTTDHRFASAEASDIALRPRNIFHQTSGGRVTAAGEDNRNDLRRLLQRTCRGSAPGDKHVGRKSNEFRRSRPHPICVGSSKTPLDLQVAIFNPAQGLKTLAQRRNALLLLPIAFE